MNYKVLLTYDFISTKPEKGLLTQLKKLEIIGLILKKLNCTVDYSLKNYSQDHFYSLSKYSKSSNIYEDITLNHLNKSSLVYLKKHLMEYDYIITYELSTNTKKILQHLEIKYIDIWLSPIRFYKDILFEFYSNDSLIQSKLQSFEFDNQKLFRRAKKIRKHTECFFETPKLAKNSCLIIGQMSQDKSVLKDGQFLNLTNFISDLQCLSNRFHTLYLLKHPLMSDADFTLIMKHLVDIKNLEVLSKVNTYHVLCRKEIKCVAGISSSVLCESKYFKKKVLYFHQPVIGHEYTRVHKKFLTSTFWKEILGLSEIQNNCMYLTDDNYLRSKYNLMYAYDIFLPSNTATKEKYMAIVQLYTFLCTIDLSQKYFLYGLGSVGMLIFPHLKNNLIAIIDLALNEKLNNYQGIPLISLHQLTDFEDYTIIITPIIHKDEIHSKLHKYPNPIIHIEV